MREITPHQRTQKSASHSRVAVLLFALVFVACLTGIGYYNYSNKKTTNSIGTTESVVNSESITETEVKTTVVKKYTELKNFTGQDFFNLYDIFAYPNTREIDIKPTITGDNDVDEHIREIALKRGYKLRAIPVSEITRKGKTVLDDPFLLQDKASVDWDALVEAAKTDGYALGTTSAFRSIEDQRDLFMQEYNNAKVVTSKVLSGQYDKTISDILALAALPGYSRHHTGYTLDFSCDKGSSFLFKDSRCYDWVSKNNFENIKKFGWIPSYPEGTAPQGPNPEPWEFVWVGKDAVYQ